MIKIVSSYVKNRGNKSCFSIFVWLLTGLLAASIMANFVLFFKHQDLNYKYEILQSDYMDRIICHEEGI